MMAWLLRVLAIPVVTAKKVLWDSDPPASDGVRDKPKHRCLRHRWGEWQPPRQGTAATGAGAEEPEDGVMAAETSPVQGSGL
jgi:hypothetical protein